jgi:hypothetical protein
MFDWKKFFNDFADRYYAVPDFNNKDHVYALQNYLIEQGMLTEDVDYAIKTLLGEAPSKPDPKVAKQAKQMGLVFLGFGNWGKKKGGPATHKNADGKLVPVGDKEPEDDKEKKDDDKDDKEKEKEEPKATVVGKDAAADRGKDHNTDVNPDYQRDGGEPKKDTENQEKAKIPTKQMKYYEVESQKESKPFDEGGITKAEKSRRARVLYAKLQMIAAEKDVEINKVDAKNLGLLRISGNARSGQLYIGDALDKAGGLKSASDKSPHYSDRNIHKNELLRNWDKVDAKLDELGVKIKPKFKQGVGYLTDKPPVINHDPVSMKPNAILEKIPTSKGTDLLSTQTRKDIEKNQGVSLGEDVFFGKQLDPKKPQTFVDNISFVVDATRDYIKNSAGDATKKYFTNFVEDLDGILKSNVNPQEKLERVRSTIKEEYSELVHKAMELNEDEGKNVLKDYGELATYMLYLSEGKETYLPKSGNYPLADIVLVNRDSESGEAQTIEGYSIKSQRGKEQQPGSSATEFLKHFSNVYPEHKEKFKSLQSLHKGSIEDVKLDEIKDIEVLEDIRKIKSIENVDSIDEMKDVAKELFDKFGDGDQKVENFMKKVDRFYEQKAKKYGIKYDMQGIGKAVIELLHREYSGMKTLSNMKELNLPSKLKFIEVVVGDKDVDIKEKGKEFSTSDFGLHDKGYLPLNDENVKKDPPPRIGKIRYASANLALRTKKN